MCLIQVVYAHLVVNIIIEKHNISEPHLLIEVGASLLKPTIVS